MPVKVYYNNQQISGEPYVSKTLTPIDHGDRWGMTESITLNGTVGFQDTQVGLTNPTLLDGFGNPYAAVTTGLVHHISDVFKVNFKPLEVWDAGSKVATYSWPSAIVESVDFDKSKWQKKSVLKYTVKLKAYDVFHIDAVTDPENSYSFSEGEDGSVSVTHKISAKGIKSGTHSPIKRAIAFVDKFVGVDHVTAGMSPTFIANRTGILLSKNENVNRLEGIYSVTENWKYNINSTGQLWLKTSKISHNDTINDEFHTINYDIEYAASPFDANGMTTLRKEINASTKDSNRYYENQLAAELRDVPSEANIYQVSISIQEDEAANKISLKGVYQTGLYNLTNGYLDWKVSLSKDEVTDIANYTANGELKTFGNIESRKAAIKTFKNANFENGETLAYNAVAYSQLFETFGNEKCTPCDNGAWSPTYASFSACRKASNCTDRIINPYPKTFKWTENLNSAAVTISAEFSDADYIDKVANAKWNVSVTAEKKLYKEMPSANVDGVYVIQDLNCHSMTTTKISTNGEVPHGRYAIPLPGPKDSFGNYEAADTVATNEMNTLADVIANVAVPNNATKYSTTIPPLKYAKELKDSSNDVTAPYSMSNSHGWIHTPTLDNRVISNPLHFRTANHKWNWERLPGYKFGH